MKHLLGDACGETGITPVPEERELSRQTVSFVFGADKRAAGGDWLNGKRTARFRAREVNLAKGEAKHLKHVLCHLVTARTSERVAALKSVKPLRECWPDISPVEEKNNRDPDICYPAPKGMGKNQGIIWS